MAIGDVVSGFQSVAPNNYMDIRPSAGNEWVIHNIYHEDMCELYIRSGNNEFMIDGDTGMGYWAWYEFHVTNNFYLRIKNVSDSNQFFAFDGVQTK